MEISLTLPRFITLKNHSEIGDINEFSWDREKITVPSFLQEDILMLQNVFEGTIISSEIYPLIYDKKSKKKESSLRSLEFYQEAVKDPRLYKDLKKNEKLFFLIGLRDGFLASCNGLLSFEEQELIKSAIGIVNVEDDEEDLIYKSICNLRATPYPTSKNKLVKFLKEENDDILANQYFIRNQTGLIICFVDPTELSYHNIENIINLDSLFTNNPKFEIKNLNKHKDGDVYTFDMNDPNNLLLSLDKLGLYTKPMNKLSRGGDRFIFSSTNLSHFLTQIIEKALTKLDKPAENFRFINWVFRFNKFKPSDKKFVSHYDTPYYDPVKKHVSKYTLLLYLTQPYVDTDPVLTFDNNKIQIETIKPSFGNIKGIIFDQKYEHEGLPFQNGDKIFIRSELIYSFKHKDFKYSDEVSKKFNIACYLTKQSIFNPELEKYASDYFNQVAQARINLAETKLLKNCMLLKNYKGIHYITNGYNYWFLPEMLLKDAAIIVLLDNLNCKFESLPSFNQLTNDEVIPPEKVKTVEDIYENLSNIKKQNISVSVDLNQLNGLDPKTEKQKFIKIFDFLHPRCISNYSDKLIHEEVDLWPLKVELEEERNEKLSERFSIVIFDQTILLSKERIKITKNQIIFETDNIPSINFASCQCNIPCTDPPENLIFKYKNAIGYNNIPPIEYASNSKGHHLKIELFDNRFVRRYHTRVRKYMPRVGGFYWIDDMKEGYMCGYGDLNYEVRYDELIDYEKLISMDETGEIKKIAIEISQEEIGYEEEKEEDNDESDSENEYNEDY